MQLTEPTPALSSADGPASSPSPAAVIGWAGIIGVICFSFWSAWCATQLGTGLVGDSVDYVAAAREISAGHGAMTLDGKGGTTPLTQFPPAYPTLLASVGKVMGIDPLAAARPVGIVLHVALVGLVIWLTFEGSGQILAAAIAGAMAAVSLPLLRLSVNLLSEVMFLNLALLAIGLLVRAVCSSDKSSWRSAAIAGCAAAAASMTRFAGSFYIVVSLLILVFYPSRSFRQRIIVAAIFAPFAILPSFLWSLRNIHLVGHPTARRFMYHPFTYAKFSPGIDVMATWLAPANLPWKATCLIVAILILATLTWMGWRRIGTRNEAGWIDSPRAAMLATMVFCIVLYPPFLAGCSSFADANILFNGRLLSPMMPCIVVLAVAVVAIVNNVGPAAAQQLNGGVLKHTLQVIGIAIALVAIGYNAYRTANFAVTTGQSGEGYATKAWNKSEMLKLINGAPKELPIYTNGFDVVYLRTGRLVMQLPKARIPSQATTNPTLEKDIDVMADRLRAGNGWIVYFNRINRKDYLLNEEDLTQRLSVEAAKRNQPSDGTIYRLKATTQAAAAQ